MTPKLRGLASHAPLLLAALLGVYPILYLVFGSFWSSSPGQPGVLTLQNYAAVAADPTLGSVLLNTLVYSVGAMIIAVSLGLVLALAVQRTDAPLKRLVSYSLLLLLALPWFVEDMGWNYLLGPRTGLYNILLSKLISVFHPGTSLLGSTFFDVNSLAGLTLVMGLSLTPLTYLVISPALALTDARLEEASLVSGAGVRTTILRIDLPLALPSVLSAALLCLIVSVEAFDVAEIIGVPGNVYVLASTVYRYFSEFPPNYGVAAAYGSITVLATVLAVVLYSRSIRSTQRFVTVEGAGSRPRTISLGRFRWVVGGGFVLFLLAYPVSVLGTLAFASLQSPVWSPLDPRLGLANFYGFLQFPNLGLAAFDSLAVALTTVAGTLALASWLAYTSSKMRTRTGRIAEVFASLPLAFPTITLGLGLLWALVFLPIPIYGTFWALTLAYTVRYVPVVQRFLSGPMVQLGRSLEEASRICGAGLATTYRRVVLPIMKPALLSSSVYVLIVSIKDLGAAVMLATGQNVLFASALFNVYTDEPLKALAGGVIFVAFLSLILLVVGLVLRVNLFSVMQPEKRSVESQASEAGE